MFSDTMGQDEWPVKGSHTVAAYIRRSTFDQENQHQMEAVSDWVDDESINLNDVEFYEDTASGADRDRDDFQKLIDDIEEGKIDHVVVWELSRIARNGLVAQEFFNLCEQQNVTIHVTDGKVITPDGRNRFVADVYASIYADERRTLIRRTKMGQKRAIENGHWVGQPPIGFTTDRDGYLIANVEFYEGYNPDSAGFYEVEAALEAIEEDDASYRGVAKNATFSRPAISGLDKDDERKSWFLDREADDDRVQSALDELEELENDA